MRALAPLSAWQELEDDLKLEDEESVDLLTWDQIMRLWNASGLPALSTGLERLMQHIALRHSSSLAEVRYLDWIGALISSNYCLEPT